MKYLILGTALALALPLTSAIGVANAQDVRISVGDRPWLLAWGWLASASLARRLRL